MSMCDEIDDISQILGRDLGGCLGGFLGGFCQPQLEIFVFLAVEGGLRVGLGYLLRIVDLHDPPSRCTITIQSWKRFPKSRSTIGFRV